MSACRQVELAVRGHVDRIRVLSMDHPGPTGAHPLGRAKLVRSVRNKFFAGRDDGDVGTREFFKLSTRRPEEADRALEPRGQNLLHYLGVADSNFFSHGESAGRIVIDVVRIR